MINEKEMTAPNVSVGADTEQSILKQTNNSITDNIKKSNDILEKLKEMDSRKLLMQWRQLSVRLRFRRQSGSRN